MKYKILIMAFFLLNITHLRGKEIGFIVLNSGKKIYCSQLISSKNNNLKFTIDKEDKKWAIGFGEYQYAQLNKCPKILIDIKKLITNKKYSTALAKLSKAKIQYYNLGWNSVILKTRAEALLALNKKNEAFLELNKLLLLFQHNTPDFSITKNLIFVQKTFWNYQKFSSAKLTSTLLIQSDDINSRIVGYYTLADYYKLKGKENLASKNYFIAFLIADNNKITEQNYFDCLVKLILQLKHDKRDFSLYLKKLKDYSLKMRNNNKVIDNFIKELTKTEINRGLTTL